jgi:hypothetical protein
MSYISNASAGFSDGTSSGGYPYPAGSHDYTSSAQYETDLVPVTVGGADYVYQISYGETISYTFWLSDGGELTLVSGEDPLIPSLLSAAQAYTASRKAYDAPSVASEFDPMRASRHISAVPVVASARAPLNHVRAFGDNVLELPPLPTESQDAADDLGAAILPVSGADAKAELPRLYDPFVIGGAANMADLPSASVARPQQADLGRTVQKPGVAASWLAT